MVPLEIIASAVASAKLYYINLLEVLLVEINSGCEPDACKVESLLGLITALTYDIGAGVNDDTTQSLYVKLLNEIDGFGDPYVIDQYVVQETFPPGSVEVDWGGIGGNIQNQTDLIALLSALPANKKTFTFLQTDLLDTAGDGNWYLSFAKESQENTFLSTTDTIIEIKINDVVIDLIRDNTFTPNRLYGFANNSSQTITITTI